MAKPMTVAEDEALKFYRLKNLMTPPELIELSELDREMSNILSRTDIGSKQKAILYYRALVKFRALFKDLFPGLELSLKEDDEKESKSKSDEKSKLQKTEDETKTNGFEKSEGEGEEEEEEEEEEDENEEGGTDEEMDEDEEEEEEEKKKEKTTKSPKKSPSKKPNFFEVFAGKPASPTKKLKTPSPTKKTKTSPSPKKESETKKKRRSVFKQDQETEDFMEKIEELIDEKKIKGKLDFQRTPTHVLWKSKTSGPKKYSVDVWNDILGFLLHSKLMAPPKFGKFGKPTAIKDIATLLYNNKLIDRTELENYPNLAQLVEHSKIRKSTTSAENRPKAFGTVVKVNFRKWNQFLNSS